MFAIFKRKIYIWRAYKKNERKSLRISKELINWLAATCTTSKSLKLEVF